MNPSLLRTKVNENTYSQQSINSVSVAPEHVALEPKIKAVVWDVKTEQDGGTTGSNNNGNSFFLYSATYYMNREESIPTIPSRCQSFTNIES